MRFIYKFLLWVLVFSGGAVEGTLPRSGEPVKILHYGQSQGQPRQKWMEGVLYPMQSASAQSFWLRYASGRSVRLKLDEEAVSELCRLRKQAYVYVSVYSAASAQESGERRLALPLGLVVRVYSDGTVRLSLRVRFLSGEDAGEQYVSHRQVEGSAALEPLDPVPPQIERPDREWEEWRHVVVSDPTLSEYSDPGYHGVLFHQVWMRGGHSWMTGYYRRRLSSLGPVWKAFRVLASDIYTMVSLLHLDKPWAVRERELIPGRAVVAMTPTGLLRIHLPPNGELPRVYGYATPHQRPSTDMWVPAPNVVGLVEQDANGVPCFVRFSELGRGRRQPPEPGSTLDAGPS